MSKVSPDYAAAELRTDGWVKRQLGRAIGWPTHVATVAVFVACLCASANYIYPFWFAVLGVPALVLWWLFRFGTFGICRVTETPSYLAGGRQWLLLPALAAGAAVLIGFDLPTRALFAAHRSRLDGLARRAVASPTSTTWKEAVGLLGDVTVTQPEPGMIGVSVPGMGVAGNDGYLCVASDVPPGPRWQYGWADQRIAPHWFKWIRASY